MNTDRIYGVLVPLIRPLVVGRMGAARRVYFKGMSAPTGRVVFLGDSITQGGMWEDLFPDLPTTNRGINGEATYDLLTRIDDTISTPKAVSLLIGTNDLHGPRANRDLDGIAERTDQIVERIQQQAPEALILLNSVTPRTVHFAPRIKRLNESYRDIADRRGATYVDLWPVLAKADALSKQFTRDNLHLNPAAYLAWAAVLKPYLAPFAVR